MVLWSMTLCCLVPTLVEASLCETQNGNASNKTVSTASVRITKQTREGPIFCYVVYLTTYTLSEKHEEKVNKKKKGTNTSVYTAIISFETTKNII